MWCVCVWCGVYVYDFCMCGLCSVVCVCCVCGVCGVLVVFCVFVSVGVWCW